MLVERFFRKVGLDEARGQIKEDPGVLAARPVHRQFLEIFHCLADQAKFKHQHAVIEPANVVVRIDHEATLEQFNS